MKTLGFFTALFLLGCGGSGGSSDSDFVGAAESKLTIAPNTIDTGDRALARIELSNVYQDGIMLKVRYPLGLRFISGSTLLGLTKDDKDAREVAPTIIGAAKDQNYLIYFINPKSSRKDDQKYYLSFEFEGTQKIRDGEIEIDADIDDPNIVNTLEFTLADPEFLAESSATINVEE